MDPHVDYCLKLEETLTDHRTALQETYGSQSDQVVIGSPAVPRPESTDLTTLERIHEWNCAQVFAPYSFINDLASLDPDPRAAILQFMIAATSDEVLLQDIQDFPLDYINDMTSTMVTSFVGHNVVMHELIDNVPDTVNPVKSELAYVQVPDGESTVLKLIWRVRNIHSRSPHSQARFSFSLKSR